MRSISRFSLIIEGMPVIAEDSGDQYFSVKLVCQSARSPLVVC
jgi:hypothetical protein